MLIPGFGVRETLTGLTGRCVRNANFNCPFGGEIEQVDIHAAKFVFVFSDGSFSTSRKAARTSSSDRHR